MASTTSQHVLPHPDGGWCVKRTGSSRATKRFETQQEAISYARKVTKKQHADLYIHRRDGMIQTKDSYGTSFDSARELHIVPDADGGWCVKKAGASKATKCFDHQKDAISYARQISKNRKGSMIYPD